MKGKMKKTVILYEALRSRLGKVEGRGTYAGQGTPEQGVKNQWCYDRRNKAENDFS